MSYLKNTLQPASLDASGRLRVGQLTTLADLKTLNEDDTLLLENTGTGTVAWADNKCQLTVTSGQYLIRRSRHYFPYFSGKSHQVEITQDGFQSQAGVVKRVGYFSSNAVDPYESNFDGFYLEDDGTAKRIVVMRYGTEVLNVAQVNWNGEDVSGYNWQNFTVLMFDFLWLGGAILRVMLKTPSGFAVLHTFDYAGTATNTFMRSPNHSVRWEIRGVSDGGTLRPICAQVSTEGSINESGRQRSVNTGATAITLAAIGTTYPIIGIRKKTTHRDRSVKQIGLSAFVSTSDQLLVSLQRNPTLSAPLTWSDVAQSAVQQGLGNGTITVTSPGQVLFSLGISQNVTIPPNVLDSDFLSSLGVSIADVSDEMVLCGTPITATVASHGFISFKEY